MEARQWNYLGHYLRREDIPPTIMSKRYMEYNTKKRQGNIYPDFLSETSKNSRPEMSIPIDQRSSLGDKFTKIGSCSYIFGN